MTNPPDPHPREDLTFDHLLGGRVSYRQPRDGLRAAIDPILLAASVPALGGDRVLEGGTGPGAALLCLAARVPGIDGTGIDRDPALLRLARDNAAANGWSSLMFVAGDLALSPVSGRFDHAFANPPYHDAGGTPSPSRSREAAKRSAPELLSTWVRALASPLRHRGTLTLVLAPASLEAALAAMRAWHVPAEWVCPIWPKEGRPARLVLVRGRKYGRSPLVLERGLVLHEESGTFRPEARAILYDGAALPAFHRHGPA